MTGENGFTLGDLQAFLLVMFRLSGMVMLAPLFGGDVVPARVRAMLSFVLALLVFPLVAPSSPLPPALGVWVVAAAQELAVGMILGFAAALLFTAAQFAGQLVDQELGLTLANVIDPVSNEQVSVIGQFKMFLGMIVWLLIFGHHSVVQAACDSFSAVPVARGFFGNAAAAQVADTMVRDLFVSAFTLAAPCLVTLFLVTVAMAFLSRVVPEMNIFILGFSFRIIVGLLLLLATVGVFARSFAVQSEKQEGRLRELVETMRPEGERK